MCGIGPRSLAIRMGTWWCGCSEKLGCGATTSSTMQARIASWTWEGSCVGAVSIDNPEAEVARVRLGTRSGRMVLLRACEPAPPGSPPSSAPGTGWPGGGPAGSPPARPELLRREERLVRDGRDQGQRVLDAAREVLVVHVHVVDPVQHELAVAQVGQRRPHPCQRVHERARVQHQVGHLRRGRPLPNPEEDVVHAVGQARRVLPALATCSLSIQASGPASMKGDSPMRSFPRLRGWADRAATVACAPRASASAAPTTPGRCRAGPGATGGRSGAGCSRQAAGRGACCPPRGQLLSAQCRR